MDNATAQTGITIWNALLIAGIPGIIIAIVGALLNHRNSLKLLDKKLKRDLDLKREEQLLEQKGQMWKIKFDLYKRLLNSFRESVVGSEGSTIKFDLELLARETYFIVTDSIMLFNNRELGDTLAELNDMIDKALDGESIDDFHGKMGKLTGISNELMKKELGIGLM